LVEIAMTNGDGTPELSYGTHFFQNLVEARIYPLPLYPHQDDTVFRSAFFQETPNMLKDLIPSDGKYAKYIKIIDVPAATDGRYLEVVMDSEKGKALGYLKRYAEEREA
jgi:pyruvate,water dikinase